MPSDISGNSGRFLKWRGYVLFLALALLPGIYLLVLESPFFSADYNYLMRLLGRVSALFGMSLMSLAFLLNTRLNFIENMFGGLDKVYKAHHIFGIAAFLSLLLHPLFLAGTYLSISVAAAARFILPGNNFEIDLGTYGLFTMELFLIFTIFAKTKYQNWLFVHRLLGTSFLLGSIHTVLIPSDVKTDILLRSYMVLMILIGSAAYIYRTLLWARLVKRYSYVVSAVKPLESSIIEMALVPENDAEAISFVPGQFIFISFQTEGLKRLENPNNLQGGFHGIVSGIANSEPHPFTISSSAYDKTIRLSIKSLGDFTKDLKNVSAGTKVKIEGPYGRFCPTNYGGKSHVWIAGGIGITPFLSVARSIEKYSLRNVDMYYCATNRQEAVFLEELSNISRENKNLNVVPFLSCDKGRITAEEVFAASENLRNIEIFICGPNAMMRALKLQFLEKGVPAASIHLEEFDL